MTTADGVVLTVEVHGRSNLPAHVPTVVLAHDWGLTRICWDRVLERVAPSGVRVVTWDQRGHGQSSLGLTRSALDKMVIDDFGRDLRAVIRTVVPPNSPVILVGHSLGGMTAMSYIAQDLNAARARVAGAVLVSTAAVAVRLGQSHKSRFSRRRKRGGSGLDDVPVRGTNHREVLFGTDPDPEAVTAVREQFAATDPAVLRAAYRAFCQADVRASFELLADLPVSILAGADDLVTPPTRSRAMTITLDRARFAALSSVGHELPYESPQRVVDELRWVLMTLRDRPRTSQRE